MEKNNKNRLYDWISFLVHILIWWIICYFNFLIASPLTLIWPLAYDLIHYYTSKPILYKPMWNIKLVVYPVIIIIYNYFTYYSNNKFDLIITVGLILQWALSVIYTLILTMTFNSKHRSIITNKPKSYHFQLTKQKAQFIEDFLTYYLVVMMWSSTFFTNSFVFLISSIIFPIAYEYCRISQNKWKNYRSLWTAKLLSSAVAYTSIKLMFFDLSTFRNGFYILVIISVCITGLFGILKRSKTKTFS